MMTFHKRRATAVFATAAALGIALSGCSLLNIGGTDTARDEDGNVTEEGDIDVFSLKVGDCVAQTDASGEVSEVPVVPCSEPHADEVYFEFTMPEGDFPGEDAINAAADEQCIPAFEDFIGMPYDESTLDYYPFTPTAEGWESLDDRVIQCLAWDPSNAELTGTLEGAAR